MHIVWFLLIGLAAGWLAGMIARGGGFGILGNLVVGVIGSLVGGFLFRLLGIAPHNRLGHLVAATAGAIVLLILLGLMGRSRGRRSL